MFPDFFFHLYCSCRSPAINAALRSVQFHAGMVPLEKLERPLHFCFLEFSDNNLWALDKKLYRNLVLCLLESRSAKQANPRR